MEKIVGKADPDSGVLREVAGLLSEEVEYYDWVGFYIPDREQGKLILGPYVGEPTEHVEIDYGEGICGQAAESGETFTVGDVTEEENYLSCSPDVDAELVVPVLEEGVLLGEIDIDSHSLCPFDSEDERFLKSLGAKLAPVLRSLPESSG